MESLTGAMVLTSDRSTGEEDLVLRRGPLAEAYEEGHWLLLDELNLAPPEALQVRRAVVCEGATQQHRS